MLEKNIVFNFPRFYSIFCVDFSQLFDPFHTYLKHGTVMGSNICEWIIFPHTYLSTDKPIFVLDLE